MKKLFALLLSLVMTVGCAPMAAAEASTGEIDYETAVAEIMRDYEKDPAAAKAALAELDTVLIGEPEKVEHVSSQPVSKWGLIGTQQTNPTDYTLLVYSMKRGNSSNYILQWRLDCHKTETNPDSLDFVSLEWDTAYAKYYSASGDGTYSSVAGRNDGIVLFNLEDDELKKDGWSQGTVYVTPEVAGEMEYGTKFTHSYTKKAKTGSMTHKFEPSYQAPKSLGLTYTFSYTVTTSDSTIAWDLWTDNAATLHL